MYCYQRVGFRDKCLTGSYTRDRIKRPNHTRLANKIENSCAPELANVASCYSYYFKEEIVAIVRNMGGFIIPRKCSLIWTDRFERDIDVLLI
jgi:hypothetical protein